MRGVSEKKKAKGNTTIEGKEGVKSNGENRTRGYALIKTQLREGELG